jgi:glutathione S-transferase
MRGSQPSRAVYTFMKHAGIPFTDKELQLPDMKTPEVLAINPAGTAPFITVDGKLYNDSNPMLRYLA